MSNRPATDGSTKAMADSIDECDGKGSETYLKLAMRTQAALLARGYEIREVEKK